MGLPHFVERFDHAELYKLTTYHYEFATLVRIHPSPLLHRRVYVHWVRDEKRSVACVGPGCVLCADHGREPRCYAPGLEWHNKQQKWVKRVIPINASCLAVLDRDLLNESYLAKRAYKAKNSPVRMELGKLSMKAMDVPDFDITPTLLRMWGCQTAVE